MVDWDWVANPSYESERIRIDVGSAPAVLYDLRLPRQLEDHEVALMLSVAEHHIDAGKPQITLVRHRRGSGVISARHRKRFADWLEVRGDALAAGDYGVVIVMPEAIYRAVLRVVYRFRAPPLRTLTTSDVPSALQMFRAELARIGQPVTPEIESFFAQFA